MGTPPPIQLGNLGMADSLILMVLALVVFGPRRLPQIGRQIGKLMYEFRKASNDFKYQMEEELRNAEDADRRKKEEERVAALALTAPAATEVASQVSDSQVSEARPEPPEVLSAASVMESVYPEETQSPSLTESGTPSEASAAIQDGSQAEALSEETHPLIRPPSTGEQVPASRPGVRTTAFPGADEALANEVGSEASAEASSDAGEETGTGPAADAEQAAHHG
jgi:sec-independent protein translocase protein TatB